MTGKVKALQMWCKKMAEGYRDVEVNNFTTSWKSGLAFCAIIHRFRPDLLDYDSLSKENIFDNNQLAFEVAETELGIPAFLEASDMVRIRVPDRLSIITYVSQYSNYFSGKPQLGGPGVSKAIKHHQDTKAPSIKESKNKVRQDTLGDKCVICDGKVYLLERQIENGKLYHRSCYRHSDLSPTSKVLKRPSVLVNDNGRSENITSGKARKLGDQPKSSLNADPEPSFWERRAAKQKEMGNSPVTKMDTTVKIDEQNKPGLQRNLNIVAKSDEKLTVKEPNNKDVPNWKKSKPPEILLTKDTENPFRPKDELKAVNDALDKRAANVSELHSHKNLHSNLKPTEHKDEKHRSISPVPQPRQFLKKDKKLDLKETKGLLDKKKDKNVPLAIPGGRLHEFEKMDTTAPPRDEKIVIPIPSKRVVDPKIGDDRLKSPTLRPKSVAHDKKKMVVSSSDSPPPLPSSCPPPLPSHHHLPSPRTSHPSSAFPKTEKVHLMPTSKLDPPHSITRPIPSSAPPSKPPRISAMDIDQSNLKSSNKSDKKSSDAHASTVNKNDSGDKTLVTGLLQSLANVRKQQHDESVLSLAKNQNDQSKSSSHSDIKRSKEPPINNVLKHHRDQLKHLNDRSTVTHNEKTNIQIDNSHDVLMHHREVITPQRPEVVSESRTSQDRKHPNKITTVGTKTEPLKTHYKKKEQPDKTRFDTESKFETSRTKPNKHLLLRDKSKDDTAILNKDKGPDKDRVSRPKSVDALSNIKVKEEAGGGKLEWQLQAEKRLAANKQGFVDPEKGHPGSHDRIVNGHVDTDNINKPLSAPKEEPTALSKNMLKTVNTDKKKEVVVHHPSQDGGQEADKPRKKILPVLPQEVSPHTPKKKVPVGIKFSFTSCIGKNEESQKKTQKPPRPSTSPAIDHSPEAKVGVGRMTHPSRSPPLKSDLGRPRLSAYEMQQQLESIDTKLTSLELRGRQLEDKIRTVEEEREDELMINWFELVNEKNDLVRQESDLIYVSREQQLEDQQLTIDIRLRELMHIPDRKKTKDDRKEEDRLITQLLDTVNQRSYIIDSIDEDKQRYEKEDKDIAEVLKEKGYHRDSKTGMMLKKDMMT